MEGSSVKAERRKLTPKRRFRRAGTKGEEIILVDYLGASGIINLSSLSLKGVAYGKKSVGA